MSSITKLSRKHEAFVCKASFVVVVVLTIASVCVTAEGGTVMPECGRDVVPVFRLFELNDSSGNFPELSCCMFNPSMCLWESVGDPTANVIQRVEPSGRVISDSRFQGEYNCKNVTDETIKEKVFYLSQVAGTDCKRCMSVKACTTETDVILIVTRLFDVSLLSSFCELVRSDGIIDIIELNTCQLFSKRDFNLTEMHTVRCPICESTHEIYHRIPDSTLLNISSCPGGFCSVIHVTSTTVRSSTTSLPETNTMAETVQTDNITTTVIETSNILQTDSFAVTTSLSPTSLTLLENPTTHPTVPTHTFAATGSPMMTSVVQTSSLSSLGSSPTPRPSSDTNGSETDASTTIGVVFGVALGIFGVIIIAICCWCYCRNKSHPKNKAEQPLKVSKPENQSIIDIMYTMQGNMEKYLVVDTLLSYLNELEVLVKEEREQLNLQILTATEKTRKLLSILESKGPQGEENFIKALYKSSSDVSGHRNLIQLLNDKDVIVKVCKKSC